MFLLCAQWFNFICSIVYNVEGMTKDFTTTVNIDVQSNSNIFPCRLIQSWSLLSHQCRQQRPPTWLRIKSLDTVRVCHGEQDSSACLACTELTLKIWIITSAFYVCLRRTALRVEQCWTLCCRVIELMKRMLVMHHSLLCAPTTDRSDDMEKYYSFDWLIWVWFLHILVPLFILKAYLLSP